jgi:release factor glutamine methyltransferase
VSLPDVRVLGTDISPGALDVARRNAAKFSVAHRIDFVQCDLLPRREGREATRGLDLICANLPYIPTDTLHALPIFGYEPTLALDGGADGLVPARRLLDIAPEWLRPGGMLLLELEATRARDARNLARALFPTGNIHLHKDLAGRDRLLEITL